MWCNYQDSNLKHSRWLLLNKESNLAPDIALCPVAFNGTVSCMSRWSLAYLMTLVTTSLGLSTLAGAQRCAVLCPLTSGGYTLFRTFIEDERFRPQSISSMGMLMH